MRQYCCGIMYVVIACARRERCVRSVESGSCICSACVHSNLASTSFCKNVICPRPRARRNSSKQFQCPSATNTRIAHLRPRPPLAPIATLRSTAVCPAHRPELVVAIGLVPGGSQSGGLGASVLCECSSRWNVASRSSPCVSSVVELCTLSLRARGEKVVFALSSVKVTFLAPP